MTVQSLASYQETRNTPITIPNLTSFQQQNNDTEYLYGSLESFKKEIIHKPMKQESIFVAIQHINEINRINGYTVVNDYDIKLIKDHFNKKLKQGREGRGSGFTEKKGSIHKNSTAEEKYRALQKAYMKLLSK